MSRYPEPKQYKPTNKEKYTGNVNDIWYRSSWEYRAMRFFDSSSHVISWSSEECVIMYKSPIDGRMHRYFTDFKVKIKDKNGNIRTFIIEVKPSSQINPPLSKQGKSKKRLLTEINTYEINQAKWRAAKDYCTSRGWEFITMDEYDLGISKRK